MPNPLDEAMRQWEEKDAANRAGLRDTRREQLQGFEEEVTSGPEDTGIGPAAATASSLVREYLLNKEDDAAGTFDPSGGMGLAAGTIKNVAKPIAKPMGDAAMAALKKMSRPVTKVPTKTAKEALDAAAKTPEAGINSLRRGLSEKKMSEINATLERHVSVPIDRLSKAEKLDLLENILLKNKKRALEILQDSQKRIGKIDAGVAKQPSQKAAYGTKGLYK
jgi:hypothetical protein